MDDGGGGGGGEGRRGIAHTDRWRHIPPPPITTLMAQFPTDRTTKHHTPYTRLAPAEAPAGGRGDSAGHPLGLLVDADAAAPLGVAGRGGGGLMREGVGGMSMLCMCAGLNLCLEGGRVGVRSTVKRGALVGPCPCIVWKEGKEGLALFSSFLFSAFAADPNGRTNHPPNPNPHPPNQPTNHSTHPTEIRRSTPS